MTDLRVSQQAIESGITPSADPKAQISQQAIEVAVVSTDSAAQISQQAVEVASAFIPTSAQISQQAVEIGISILPLLEPGECVIQPPFDGWLDLGWGGLLTFPSSPDRMVLAPYEFPSSGTSTGAQHNQNIVFENQDWTMAGTFTCTDTAEPMIGISPFDGQGYGFGFQIIPESGGFPREMFLYYYFPESGEVYVLVEEPDPVPPANTPVDFMLRWEWAIPRLTLDWSSATSSNTTVAEWPLGVLPPEMDQIHMTIHNTHGGSTVTILSLELCVPLPVVARGHNQVVIVG